MRSHKTRCDRERRPGRRAEKHIVRGLGRRRCGFALPAVFVSALLAGLSVLQAQTCNAYVAPFFQGQGGIVVQPTGSQVTFDVSAPGKVSQPYVVSTIPGVTLVQGVNLGGGGDLVLDMCTNTSGSGPVECRLAVEGIESGGWYWMNAWGIRSGSGKVVRNAATAPFICEDQLGGRAALEVDGVTETRSVYGTGTLLVHDNVDLMGIVPHLHGAPVSFDLDPSNDGPRGITEVAGVIYVADWGEEKIFAYRRDGTRLSNLDFPLTHDGNFQSGRSSWRLWDDLRSRPVHP